MLGPNSLTRRRELEAELAAAQPVAPLTNRAIFSGPRRRERARLLAAAAALMRDGSFDHHPDADEARRRFDELLTAAQAIALE